MKVVVFTLGCKVNQYESDVLVKLLSDRGYEVSERLCRADYYIVNTCAVTGEAEKKSRQCIARARRLNPDAKILVCGCASQNNPRQFEKDGVIYISGTAKKDSLAALKAKNVNMTDIPTRYEEIGFARSLRTRSYIKVQDGCNNFCSYCLIPYLRGRSRSRSVDSVVAEIRALPLSVKEIVLTGINLSAYGDDCNGSLCDLISALSFYDGRIRLGSFETNVISDELLSALKGLKRFCPHFHLSLQSGDDDVLRKMNRHYTTDAFYENVLKIRKAFPDAAVTTDVIAGFPTETERQFLNSAEFLKKAAFADAHVFAYSKREGTVAARMEQVSAAEIAKRAEYLSVVRAGLKAAFVKRFAGRPLSVLFEDSEDGLTTGYSENYVKVYSDAATPNSVVTVTPAETYKDGLLCKE